MFGRRSSWVVAGVVGLSSAVAVVTSGGASAAPTAPTTIVAGAPVSLSSTFQDGHGHPLAGVPVELLVRGLSQAPFTVMMTVTTDSAGAVSATVHPVVNSQYEWQFLGNATDAATTSPITSIKVHQAIHAYLTTSSHYPNLTFYGTVSPRQLGGIVYLQVMRGGTWHSTSLSALLHTQKLPNGTTQLGYVLHSTITGQAFRIVRPATARVLSGASRTFTVH